MVLLAIGNTVAKCAVTICNTGTSAVTNAFICIPWLCYATENGNNCTVTAKYTCTDTNTATSTITAIILLWLLLLEYTMVLISVLLCLQILLLNPLFPLISGITLESSLKHGIWKILVKNNEYEIYNVILAMFITKILLTHTP